MGCNFTIYGLKSEVSHIVLTAVFPGNYKGQCFLFFQGSLINIGRQARREPVIIKHNILRSFNPISLIAH